MKRLMLAGLMATALLHGQNFGQTSGTGGAGTIDVLVRLPGGIPIEGAFVTVTRNPYSKSERRNAEGKIEIIEAPADSDARTTLSATSDRSGHAIFQNLAKGNYRIYASHEGFYFSGDGGPVTTFIGDIPMTPGDVEYAKSLPKGQDDWHHSLIQQINLRLIPTSVISGRVHDSKGNPVIGIRVTALGVNYAENGQAFLDAKSSVQTDDRGNFRIFWLKSGEYFLRIDRTETKVPEGSKTFPIPYYYPGTFVAGEARHLLLRDGDEINDIDFNAAPLPATVNISGIVINPFPGASDIASPPVRDVSMFLIREHTGLIERAAYFSNILHRADNETEFPFEIRGVPPGSYELYAVFHSWKRDETIFGRNKNYVGRKRIEVDGSNMSGLTVTILKGADVQGSFINTGEDPEPNLVRIMTSQSVIWFLALIDGLPAEAFDIGELIGPMEMGGLTISNAMESRYRIMGFSLFDDEYLSDMRQDGRSVYDDGVITVETAPVNLELTRTRNGGSIDGRVDLLRLDDPWAPISIVLVPDIPRRGNLLLYKTTSINGGSPEYRDVLPDGSFRLNGIAPGNYKIFAWENLPVHAERNSEFIARYESRGVPVTVTQGMKIKDVQLLIISR